MASELTQIDQGFLNFCEQIWSVNGCLPSRELCEQYGFDKKHYTGLLRRSDYRAQLIARGISSAALDSLSTGRKGPAAISELQLTAVAVMLDPHDRRSKSKRLSELGISTGVWNKWLQDPAFKQYITERANALLGEYAHESRFALIQKMRTGDLGAIKYFDEVTGFYTPVTSGGGSGNNAFDARAFVVRIMEAVQKHCSPEQSSLIADELLGYATANGFASRIMETIDPVDIPVPGNSNETDRRAITSSGPTTNTIDSKPLSTREVVLDKLKAGGL